MTNDIYTELSKKYGIDKRIISQICGSPFRCARKIMQDAIDEGDIRFPYLFKIRLKNKFKNGKVQHTSGLSRVSRKTSE